MNENKRIDNPRITIVECVGGRWLLRWKNAWNHDYKNSNGRNFQFTKFSFTDFFLADRRSLSGKRQKSASGKSSSCRFSFSAERNTDTKATKYVTFGFSFSILVFFPFKESLNLTVCQQWGIFSVLAAIIRGISRQTTCIENREGFSVHSSTWPSGRQRRLTCQQPISYINRREKIRYFFACVVTAFLRAENPCITPRFMR